MKVFASIGIALALAVFATAQSSGATSLVSLTFDQSVPGTKLDKNSVGTGFTGVQPNKNGDQYQPQLLEVTGGRLIVDPTPGDAFTTTNTQQNALETDFDGSAPFAVTASLPGPINLEKSVYGGIFVGRDQDNYVKLVIGNTGVGQVVQRLREVNGALSTQPVNAAEAGLLTASSVTLSLEVTPASGAVQARYSLNGGPFTNVGQAVTLAGVGGPQALAGIITTDQSGNDDTRLAYDSFAVTTLNPAPTATGLEPGTTPAGGPGLTLSVGGSGFTPDSQVLWNGQARATTFMNAAQLAVAIPASDLAVPGTDLVSVTTPAPGGGDSLALPFLVTPPVPVPIGSGPAPAVSPQTAGAIAVPPANSASPRLDGTPRVGRSVRCTPGTWTGVPTDFQTEWLRDGRLVVGHASTYVPVGADSGHRLSCRVVARNAVGAAAAESSRLVVASKAQPAAHARPLQTRVAYQGVATGGLLNLTRFSVLAPNGSSVSIRCARRCTLGATRVAHGGRADFSRSVDHAFLPTGAVIEVRARHAGATAILRRLTVTNNGLSGIGGAPRCLAAASDHIVPCPGAA